MARRKKLILNYDSMKNLEMRDLIVAYLGFNYDLMDYELTSMEIHFQQKLSYKIRDIDTAIFNLENYLSKNKHLIHIYNGLQFVVKKDLAKMIKVSRPTLDKWIKNGFIQGTTIGSLQIYPPDDILKQLKKYKKSTQNN